MSKKETGSPAVDLADELDAIARAVGSKLLPPFLIQQISRRLRADAAPIPMLLWCPECGKRHVDQLANDGTDWSKKIHTKHSCQGCGMTWRPAGGPTTGGQFRPRFKNDEVATKSEVEIRREERERILEKIEEISGGDHETSQKQLIVNWIRGLK
jgi:rubredoxin